jgi:uncharacterized Zn finger protein (UPF0148 family)
MTYDDWKAREPQTSIGFTCDGCRLLLPEEEMTWHSGEVYCPRCQEKYLGELDGEFAE